VEEVFLVMLKYIEPECIYRREMVVLGHLRRFGHIVSLVENVIILVKQIIRGMEVLVYDEV
jgi:hypothetical protein